MLQEFVNIINETGLTVVLVGYFLYKDYKFNDQIISVLSEVKEVLTELRTWHEKEGNKQ